MCGFTGVIAKDEQHSATNAFMQYAMKDLYRRGPDEQHIWESSDKKASLGFARLAIRDLTSNGRQPMLSDDNRWVIMYNGETYNTEELIAFAGIEKSMLQGTSDTEIILKSIERKGVHQTIAKMDGIFAIAAFDQVENTLYLVRDHLGIKPLYFGINNQGVVFSSHYHHVVKHPYFSQRHINADALVGYFTYGFIQSGEGLFHDTFLVPPAHITTISLQNFTFDFSKYAFTGKLAQVNLGDTIERVVHSQLVSDVPVGTFLSGGIDSAIVTAYASKAKQNMMAFTIGVNDNNLDETGLAQVSANALGVNHQVHQVTGKDILSTIQQYDDSLAEPLADYSSLLTLKVCEVAKQNLTVVLSGDGGDELFWGYSRMHNFWKYYPHLKQRKYIRLLSILFARLKGNKIPLRLLKFKSPFEYYLSAQGLTGNKEWLPVLLTNPVRNTKSYTEIQLFKIYKQDIEQWLKQTELDIHLQRVLLKVDRASMYHSLEVRTPLLSPVVVAHSENFSRNDCANDGLGKVPLRELLTELIKVNQVSNASKKGFEPPMANWMRNELKNHIEKRIENIPEEIKSYINQMGIEKLWASHQNGEDKSWPIWAVYSLCCWFDKIQDAQ